LRGKGRSRIHGGKSPGAPKGNRNAFKHGLYSAEAIAHRRKVWGAVAGGAGVSEAGVKLEQIKLERQGKNRMCQLLAELLAFKTD
jgi:hypothetical protein